MSVAESTGTGLCSNEHEDISEKCSVSKEHGGKPNEIIVKEVHVRQGATCRKGGSNARRYAATGRRDGVRSLCAASKAKEEEPWPRLGACEGTPGRVVAVDVFVAGMVDA